MNGPASGLEVEGHDETTSGFGVEHWGEVAERTLMDEGVVIGHLDLFFVEPDVIAELNVEHLGHEGPTDVLAFPLDGPTAADPTGRMELMSAGLPPHLGDVVICPAVAAEQAAEHTGAVDAELTLLVVHGVLHVLGHDHAEPDEARQMQERERHHLLRHGFSHPVLP